MLPDDPSDSEELSIREAANLLNVTRTYVTKLIDERAILHRKVGLRRRRRVLRQDAVAHKQKMRVEALEAMQELTDQAQELKLGYE